MVGYWRLIASSSLQLHVRLRDEDVLDPEGSRVGKDGLEVAVGGDDELPRMIRVDDDPERQEHVDEDAAVGQVHAIDRGCDVL